MTVPLSANAKVLKELNSGSIKIITTLIISLVLLAFGLVAYEMYENDRKKKEMFVLENSYKLFDDEAKQTPYAYHNLGDSSYDYKRLGIVDI